MTWPSESDGVATVLVLYADLPDTPLRPTPQDHAMARRPHEHCVPLSLVESALLPWAPPGPVLRQKKDHWCRPGRSRDTAATGAPLTSMLCRNR